MTAVDRLASCTGATLTGIAIGLCLPRINRALLAVEHAVERHHAARSCAITAATRARRAQRIQDVTELLAAGESAGVIAHRLGLAPGTLAQALKRAGRPDLASQFWSADWHERHAA